ncbi:MAG: glycosyl hydrolase [Sphaerobacter sp.]|nr:glycosyl hydrolase [Sphaerobacter sp.]
MKPRASARGVRVCLILLLAAILPLSLPEPAAARNQADPQDFFGIVGRDPWYEYNTNPEQFPNDVNRTFLDNLNAGMAEMGARWVRIEFHAEYDEPIGPGRIDWSKHDWYVRDSAPRHGLKILAVLGSGILADLDKTYQFKHINDRPGQDGTNTYSRAFVQRTHEILEHYGDAIPAYEILNEPNANQLLHWETNGREKAVNPDIYGQIATEIYTTEKPAHPGVQFIVGSLLYDAADGDDEHLEWLREVYESPAVTRYRDQHGRYPWDGVSIHPYYLSPPEVLAHLQELRALQEEYGDTTGIWVTEIGWPAAPAEWTSFGIMDPTASEREQVDYLYGVYTTLRDQAPYVERVFWFKYEDFGGGGTYANWGLVRLRDSSFRYGPDATPWPRKPAFSVYQALARPDRAPTAPVPAPPDVGPRVRYFPETGHTLRDPFLRYWETNGGLAQFGFPLTEVFFVQGRAVQYFERARFEYWPELRGTPHEVQLGLLGRYVTRGRTFLAAAPPAQPEPGRIYFPQTGHYLSYGFKDYWERNGGLAVFGYPISEEFTENGYTVQYFERARFEWHPEYRGTPFEVLLGHLGREVLSNPGWYR